MSNTDIKNCDNELFDISHSYKYDKYGNILEISDQNKVKKNFRYDLLNRQTAEILEDNTTREIKYEDKTNILQTVDATGTKLKYFYDTFGKLVKIVDPQSDQILLKREYDEKDRLKEETNAIGTTSKYTYDYNNRITKLNIIDNANIPLSSYNLEYDDAFSYNHL